MTPIKGSEFRALRRAQVAKLKELDPTIGIFPLDFGRGFGIFSERAPDRYADVLRPAYKDHECGKGNEPFTADGVIFDDAQLPALVAWIRGESDERPVPHYAPYDEFWAPEAPVDGGGAA